MSWIDVHLPVLAVLLPSITAIVLLLIGDHGGEDAAHGHRKLLWARRLALASVFAGLLIAARLVTDASDGAVRAYLVGEWPAPYGIALENQNLWISDQGRQKLMRLPLTSLVANKIYLPFIRR